MERVFAGSSRAHAVGDVGGRGARRRRRLREELARVAVVRTRQKLAGRARGGAREITRRATGAQFRQEVSLVRGRVSGESSHVLVRGAVF